MSLLSKKSSGQFMEDKDHHHVPTYFWVNSDGSMGGLVAETAQVHPTVFVDPLGCIRPDAVVPAGTRIGPDHCMLEGHKRSTFCPYADP